MVATLLLLMSQSPLQAPLVASGRVVAEADGKPIPQARVTPATEWNLFTPAFTDDSGRYTFEPRLTEHPRVSLRPKLDSDQMEVAAEGFVTVIVDTASCAPWADVIPLRRAVAVGGHLRGAGPAYSVIAQFDPVDFVWPPQSGMTIVMKSPSSGVAQDDSFTIQEVPVGVRVTLQAKCPADDDWRELGHFVFDGSVNQMDLKLPPPLAKKPRATEKDSDEWHFVGMFGRDSQGTRRANVWFDVLPESRHNDHPFGGGRWHLHGNRACDCIVSRLGERLLVARDPDGWFGTRTINLTSDTRKDKFGITMSMGALIRIQMGAVNGRVALFIDGQAFAVRDALAGEVWYALSPAGSIRIEVDSPGRESRLIQVTTVAGETRRVQIAE